ncbi:hypothetical protein O5264_29640, partial [Escherichia coli]|nr:hypothetical protein [Escherichia coli]
GMLKGFIDLVFRHEGRYYLLDYKRPSNSPSCWKSTIGISWRTAYCSMVHWGFDINYLRSE